jgi:hypothetical protein
MTNPSSNAQAQAQAAFDACGIFDGTQATDLAISPSPLADGSVNAAFQPESAPRKSSLQ